MPLDEKQHLTKSNTLFKRKKKVQQGRNRRELPQPDKGIYIKAKASTIFHGKRLNVSLSYQEQDMIV